LTAAQAAETKVADAVIEAKDELEHTRPCTKAGIIAKAKACRALAIPWDTRAESLIVDIGVLAGEVLPEHAEAEQAKLLV
jgi:hypothetical protein